MNSMEHCAPSVFPQEAGQRPADGILQEASGFPRAATAPEGSSQTACQLLEDANSGARFMKGILLGSLLSASIWAGILLLAL